LNGLMTASIFFMGARKNCTPAPRGRGATEHGGEARDKAIGAPIATARGKIGRKFKK